MEHCRVTRYTVRKATNEMHYSNEQRWNHFVIYCTWDQIAHWMAVRLRIFKFCKDIAPAFNQFQPDEGIRE